MDDVCLYKVKYSKLFERDLVKSLDYIAEAHGVSAADNLREKVELAVEKRSFNPASHRVYNSVKDPKQPYYTIKVGSYYVFYVVKGNTMIIRRFIYAMRDLESIV
ncbi:MAG: type II toxin-antitoxin system RelE/ParE family toxin [Oscillospiraceae bacterium]|nr:type II toxin-antitoxin system RelE/ParE family toxin [Oscillospiraceae bacterium]